MSSHTMWKGNAATERLGIRRPIVQGPFGGGLSTVKLTSAVSNAGALGSFGAHQLSPDEIQKLVGELRRATSGPFAINLWVSNSHELPGMTRAEYQRGLDFFEPIYKT